MNISLFYLTSYLVIQFLCNSPVDIDNVDRSD